MLAAPESRLGLFWVAFIVQGVNQPYELSQNVSKSPFLSLNVPSLRYAHMQLTERNMRYQ